MEEFDVLIIGGGVVGCTISYELTCAGYKCCLLEKNDSLVSEASSGNGGVLHTGFDAPEGSIELKCIKLCQQRIYDVLHKTGLPVKQCGAVLVARTLKEDEKLLEIKNRSKQNGIEGVHEISLSELYQREPHLAKNATRCLWVEKEGVLDPCLLPLVLTHIAIKNGAKVILNQKVIQLSQPCSNAWEVHTSNTVFHGKSVINAAGLHGDVIDQLSGHQLFGIKPRKGQWVVYGKSPSKLLNSIILPVPSERTKGTAVLKSVYDNVIVGPTADETQSRGRAIIEPHIREKLLRIGHSIVPELNKHSIVGEYTGSRPATEIKDYIIKAYPQKNWITVGGIRSTGVSACLGISEYVLDLLRESLTIEPIGSEVNIITHIPYTVSPAKTLHIEGRIYNIAHPITQFGSVPPNKL